MRTRIVEIAGGVQVVGPDSLNLLTPFVLFEQQDWFEDEIGFVRRLLRPGQHAIDVGANYGVYTLTIPKTVGPTGAVWAFEPTSSTAALLVQGIAANGFTQVSVESSAISNAQHHFMKIDAEGEESNIIVGGLQFFTDCSPLILYEIKGGAGLNLELVQQFARTGFESYRLILGLDLLVPFHADSQPDGFLLKLFCCKKDRAALLTEMGLLLDAATISTFTAARRFENFYQSHSDEYAWDRRLSAMPCATALSSVWSTPTDTCAAIGDILACYTISQDANLNSFERLRGLEVSIQLLRSLGEAVGQYLRLSTLARVARDHGARSVAVYAAKHDNISVVFNSFSWLWQRRDGSASETAECAVWNPKPAARIDLGIGTQRQNHPGDESRFGRSSAVRNQAKTRHALASGSTYPAVEAPPRHPDGSRRIRRCDVRMAYREGGSCSDSHPCNPKAHFSAAPIALRPSILTYAS